MKLKIKDILFTITFSIYMLTFLFIGIFAALGKFKICLVIAVINGVLVISLNEYIKNKKKSEMRSIKRDIEEHFYSSGITQEASEDIENVIKILEDHN